MCHRRVAEQHSSMNLETHSLFMLQLLAEQMNLNVYQYIFTALNNLNESFCFVGNFHNATETKISE